MACSITAITGAGKTMILPQKMKAAVLYGPSDLKVTEVDVPAPGWAEVLVRVEACAICGSDVSLIDQAWPGQPPYGQFIPGHEYSGTIVALGDSVDEFSMGERVAVEVHKGCNRCINCKTGNYTSCLNYGNTAKGHRANGFTTNGGYSQYVVNHINTIYKIPDTISFEEASLITTAGCPMYGFEAAGGFIAGDTVVIIGPGPMGLMSVQIAKALCAAKVVLTGTRQSRLQLGKQLGADHIIDIKKQDPVAAVKKLTGPYGADLVVECSGSDVGLQTAVELVKKAGRILLIGFSHGMTSADFGSATKKNITIFTVRGEGRSNCARALSLMEQKKINAGPLITHTFPLAKVREALDTYTRRIDNAIKVVLKTQLQEKSS